MGPYDCARVGNVKALAQRLNLSLSIQRTCVLGPVLCVKHLQLLNELVISSFIRHPRPPWDNIRSSKFLATVRKNCFGSRSGWRATWPAAAVVPASCPGLASCRWSWLAVAALVSCCSRLCSPTWPLQLPLSPLVEAFLTRFEASCNSSFFWKKTVNSTVFLTCLHSKGNSLFLSAACSPDVCEAKVWGPVVFSASTSDLRVFQMTSFYLNKQHEIHGMNSIVLFYTFFKH